MEKANTTSTSYWLSSGFYALLNQLTQMVFNLGSVMLLLRMLDKQTCGSWILFMTLTSFIEVARTGLLQNGMISFLSTAPKSEYPKILTASVVLNLGLSFVFAALILGGGHFVASFYGNDIHLTSLLKIYALTTFAFSALYQFNFIQQANLDFKGLFWSSFVKNGGLFVFIAYLFFAHKSFSLTDIAFCQFFTTIPSALVAYGFARPYLNFSKKIDAEWVKKLLHYGKFAMGTNFFTMLFKNVDRTLLGKFALDSLSTYDLALKINQLAEVPTTTLATILFPKSAQRANDADGGRSAARQLYEKSVGVLLALILPMTIGVLFFADVMVQIIGSEKYAAAAPILRMTIFYGFFTAYAIQFGTILDSLKRPDLNFYITALGAAVNFSCNYFFIKQIGLHGAIYGTLLGSTIMFLVMQFVLNRTIGTSPLRPFVYMIDFYQQFFQKVTIRFRKKTSVQEAVVIHNGDFDNVENSVENKNSHSENVENKNKGVISLEKIVENGVYTGGGYVEKPKGTTPKLKGWLGEE